MSKRYSTNNMDHISRYCYYAGLGIGILVFAGTVLLHLLGIYIHRFIPPCFCYKATGYYCPGCGGTRATMALLHGDILLSLRYHPFVVYIITYFIVFEVSHTLNIATKGKIKGMPFCPLYFYIGIAIILVQWVIKNYLRFYYGFSL